MPYLGAEARWRTTNLAVGTAITPGFLFGGQLTLHVYGGFGFFLDVSGHLAPDPFGPSIRTLGLISASGARGVFGISWSF